VTRSPDERADVRAAELVVLAHLHSAPWDAALLGAVLAPEALTTPWLRRMYGAALRGVAPAVWVRRHMAPADLPAGRPRFSSALRVVQPARQRFPVLLTAAQLAELLGCATGQALALEQARWLAAGAAARRARWVCEARLDRLQAALSRRLAAGLPLGELARAYDLALEALR